MAYSDQAALAVNEAFIAKVRVAMCDAAIDVKAEADTEPNHLERAQFADRALRFQDETARNLAWGVVTNGAITASSTDSDIQFTVNSMWTAFSYEPPA